ERFGAVDRIDDPTAPGRADLFRLLFTEDPVVGEVLFDEFAQQSFRTTVGDRHRGAIAFALDGNGWITEILQGVVTRLAQEVDGGREKLGVCSSAHGAIIACALLWLPFRALGGSEPGSELSPNRYDGIRGRTLRGARTLSPGRSRSALY